MSNKRPPRASAPGSQPAIDEPASPDGLALGDPRGGRTAGVGRDLWNDRDLQRLAELASPAPREPASPSSRWRVHLGLYLATWVSAVSIFGYRHWVDGLIYSAALMTILTAHEMGHYLQARRYGIPASLPYFLPLPFLGFGTLGAVIAMRSQRADARALFDLAITGPLAGLVPTILFSAWGLELSTVAEAESEPEPGSVRFGSRVIFRVLASTMIGPVEPGHVIDIHPIGFAGWVGVFITALNLIPISQSDGGHILYTLIPRSAHKVSLVVFVAALAAVLTFGLWDYLSLIALLSLIFLFFGFRHPPLAEGGHGLDRWRQVLGWLTLAFVFIGLTANPIQFTGPHP